MRLPILSIILLAITISFVNCSPDPDPPPPVANAGASQTVQLPTSTTTLTGTGTAQSGGTITGYLWSLVSGPNVPVINSPASASTVVNSLVAGTYIFQLRVVDNRGLAGLDTMSVVVLPAVQTTVTYQPANNNVNELNFAGNTTQNGSAHDIDIDAAAWTMGGNPWTLRGAVKFDLSNIPAGKTIVSARLSLYSNPTPINGDLVNANSGTSNAMYIRRINSAWNGNTSTWQTQPTSTTADQILIPHTTQSFLDLVDIDVTTLVTAMYTGNNYGFMLNLQNEVAYNIRQFCSSNHSQAAKRPKLVVIYQ